jgi:flagellar basal-body rod protein FlgB
VHSLLGLYVLELASDAAEWLTQRQTLVAGNIANANTPGYHARDLAPFSEILAGDQIKMAATKSVHFQVDTADEISAQSRETGADEETLSANSVSLEKELTTLGEIGRQHALNANIKHAIQQMLLMVSK